MKKVTAIYHNSIRSIVLVVIFLCGSFPCIILGQDDVVVDSLRKVLQNKKLSDTSIIRLRTDIGQLGSIFRVAYWDSIAKDCERFLQQKTNAEVKIKLQFYLAGAVNNTGYIYKQLGDLEKATEKYNESLAHHNKIVFGKDTALRNKVLVEKAQTINNLATIYAETGDVEKGKEYHLKSLEIRKQVDDKEGIALSYNNLGYIAINQGDIKQALGYYFESLKIREEIEDWKGLGQVYGNIAALYSKHYGMEKAIEFHRKALVCWIKAKEESGIAHSLNNIGTCYVGLNNIDSALINYEKALKIRTEINYKKGIGNSYYNIARVYTTQKKLNEAQIYFEKSLEILTEVKDKLGVIQTLQLLSELHLIKGNNNEALKKAELSLKMAKEMGFVDPMQRSAGILYKVYAKLNQPKQALQMYELHIRLRDSISNVENKKQAISKQFEYQYEKKSAADSVRMEKEKEIQNAKLLIQDEQLKQEATQRYALYGGLALTLVFGGFIYNRFKITQKQKTVIEHQKLLVDEKNHLIQEKQNEIIDSINYAQRIQRSLLASDKLLNENLNEFFILFKPKDIVSGDFYWATRLKNNTFIFATADSTGHGVPGAIMSMLNIACLNEAISKDLLQPHDILFETRNRVIDHLKNDGSGEGGKDGMDCSLICIDFSTRILTAATANNPVWIVRNNVITELKPDKMPVGKHDRDNQPFSLHTFQLEKGDAIYTLTDGYPDQFGGDKGKKFTTKRLREFIISNSNLTMNEQKKMLEANFEKWANDLEQLDDVTVVGIRV